MQGREAIYAALFTRIRDNVNSKLGAGVPSIQTFVRRFIPTSRVDLQPALLMLEVGERQELPGARGVPNKAILIAHCFIYTRDGADPNAVSASNLNNLLDAVEELVSPQDGIEQTLGGLVHWTRLSGRQSIYEAAQDVTQATSVLEIQMLATT
jgi:hypothetical protein